MKRTRRRKLKSFSLSKTAKALLVENKIDPIDVATFCGGGKITVKEVKQFLKQNS